MEASLSQQTFSNLGEIKKSPFPSLMKASHNSSVVMTGLCTTLSLPPSGQSLCIHHKQSFSHHRVREGRENKHPLLHCYLNNDFPRGEREYRAVTEVALLQEAPLAHRHCRMLSQRLLSASYLNRNFIGSLTLRPHQQRLPLYISVYPPPPVGFLKTQSYTTVV